ncbi:MAG: phytanoyl-CoA dioxygenase family protein [Myxococcales bacterium]|nr:phytanoyl-CoA dioxygenase family protein [Myxococcales bacterium]
MRLSAGQRRALERDGFVHAGQPFDAGELAEIGREYDRLVGFEHQVLGNQADGVFPYRAMLHFRSPALRRYVNHPELMELAMQLLGPDVRLWWDQGIDKAPGSGSAIRWHQDNGYQQGRVPEYFTTWLALDDSDLANGGLQAIPGSHRRGLLPHHMETVHAVVDEGWVDESEAVALDARAGDLLVFSSLLVHQTVGNHTSDRHRRSWVLQYAPADLRNETTGEVYDDREWVLKDGAIVAEPWSERRLTLGARSADRTE